MQSASQPIILIDDNPAHRKLVKRALNKAGIQNTTFEAHSLASARCLLEENEAAKNAALLIIDLNLGDGRGTTLVKECKTNPSFTNTPIIIFSTSALENDIKESYDSGANCYLIKAGDLDLFGSELARSVSFLLQI